MNHSNLYEQIQTDLEETPYLENHVLSVKYSRDGVVGYRFQTSVGRKIEVLNQPLKDEEKDFCWAEDHTNPNDVWEILASWAAVCWGQLKMRAAYERRTAG